jgi:hypothetical protein
MVPPRTLQKDACERDHEQNRFRNEQPGAFWDCSVDSNAKQPHCDCGCRDGRDQARPNQQAARREQADGTEYRE